MFIQVCRVIYTPSQADYIITSKAPAQDFQNRFNQHFIAAETAAGPIEADSTPSQPCLNALSTY
jgi:hypothetical protein